jgi:chromosome segregation ATPase
MTDVETEELRRQLVEVHEQLLERDQEFRCWRAELRNRDKTIDALERDNTNLRTGIEALSSEINAMQATRVWRLGLSYWTTREALKRVLRLRRESPDRT